MKNKEWSFVDKSNWGAGFWQSEPDKVQYVDSASGMPCLIVRNPHMGHLCGYVGVSKSHPYYERDYNACDVDVHGGLTFADKCHESLNGHGICHFVEEGEDDDVWWLGFDCGHVDDLLPGAIAETKHILGEKNSFTRGTYRRIDYVRKQNTSLAAQLLAIGNAK